MLNLRCNPGHPCRNEIRVQIALAEPDQVGRKATRIFHLGVLEPRNRDSSIEPERWMDLPFRTTALDNPAANFLYSSWALYNHLLLGLRASAIPMHSLVCLWMKRSWSAHFQEARSKVKAAKGYCMSIQSILCTLVKCTLTTFRFLDFNIWTLQWRGRARNYADVTKAVKCQVKQGLNQQGKRKSVA